MPPEALQGGLDPMDHHDEGHGSENEVSVLEHSRISNEKQIDEGRILPGSTRKLRQDPTPTLGEGAAHGRQKSARVTKLQSGPTLGEAQ